MEKELFKASSAKIFKGILVALIASIVSGILLLVGGVAALGGAASGSDGALGAGVFIMILAVLAGLASIYGYFLQYQGAGELEQAVDAADAPHIAKVKTAFLLLLIGIAVSTLMAVLPILGTVGSIISGLLSIAGSILCLMAFGELRKSTTFPSIEGASKLWTAYLLYVIGYGCAITIIFIWATPILTLIGFIFALIGWNKLKSIDQSEQIKTIE